MPAENLTKLAKASSGGDRRFARWAKLQRVHPAMISFGLATIALVLCFGVPLYRLLRFAAASELYSHILLVPFVSLYLTWLKLENLAPRSSPAPLLAALAWLGGIALLVAAWYAGRSGWEPTVNDSLAITTGSFLLFFLGIGCLLLGKDTLRAIAFPLGFLIFFVPMPAGLEEWIKASLQRGSVIAAQGFFQVSGTPFVRQGTAFQLPGFNLEVAPQCSGIHSSLVLFLTSLVAGHLFLRTPWKRAALTLAVIPLALLRNGLRVFTIGELCVHISPDMVHSPIHHHGGPLFFALSLVPFFLLLIFLRRSDFPSMKGSAHEARQTVG